MTEQKHITGHPNVEMEFDSPPTLSAGFKTADPQTLAAQMHELIHFAAGILRAVPGWVLVCQIQGKESLIFLNGNSRVAEILACPIPEARGKQLKEIWPPAGQPELVASLVQCVETATPFESESVTIPAGQDERVVHVYAFPVAPDKVGLYIEDRPDAQRQSVVQAEETLVELSHSLEEEKARREAAEQRVAALHEELEARLAQAEEALLETREQLEEKCNEVEKLLAERAELWKISSEQQRRIAEFEIRQETHAAAQEDLARALEERARAERQLGEMRNEFQAILEKKTDELQNTVHELCQEIERLKCSNEQLQQANEELEGQLAAKSMELERALAGAPDDQGAGEHKPSPEQPEISEILAEEAENLLSSQLLEQEKQIASLSQHIQELSEELASVHERLAKELERSLLLEEELAALRSQVASLPVEPGEEKLLEPMLSEETMDQPGPPDVQAPIQSYQLLFENFPFGILCFDTQGNVTELNRQAVVMLAPGLPDGSPGEEYLRALYAVDPAVAGAVRKGFELGEPFIGEFSFTNDVGRRMHLRIRVVPQKSAQGEHQGAQVVIEDIVDRKRAEQRIITTERLKAFAEMASGAAAGFKELVTALQEGARATASALEQGDTGQLQNILESLEETTRRAGDTARSLEQFAQGATSQATPPEGHVFDLSEAVRAAIEQCGVPWQQEPDPSNQSPALETDLKRGCWIQGDEEEITQAVVNILRNAAEALPFPGEVWVKTYLHEGSAVCQIRDNGVGIAKPDLTRIFEPFWTQKPGHTGLGLAAAFAIANRHGGKLAVNSNVGEGTTFALRLPFARDAAARAGMESLDTEAGYRILLIFDMKPVVKIVQNGLSKYGHQALVALSAEEGIRLFRENRVDAVVCDLTTDPMTPKQVSKALSYACEELDIPKPPFITLITPGSRELPTADEESEINHLEQDRVVEKPVTISRLLEIVTEEVSCYKTFG